MKWFSGVLLILILILILMVSCGVCPECPDVPDQDTVWIPGDTVSVHDTTWLIDSIIFADTVWKSDTVVEYRDFAEIMWGDYYDAPYVILTPRSVRNDSIFLDIINYSPYTPDTFDLKVYADTFLLAEAEYSHLGFAETRHLIISVPLWTYHKTLSFKMFLDGELHNYLPVTDEIKIPYMEWTKLKEGLYISDMYCTDSRLSYRLYNDGTDDASGWREVRTFVDDSLVEVDSFRFVGSEEYLVFHNNYDFTKVVSDSVDIRLYMYRGENLLDSLTNDSVYVQYNNFIVE